MNFTNYDDLKLRVCPLPGLTESSIKDLIQILLDNTEFVSTGEVDTQYMSEYLAHEWAMSEERLVEYSAKIALGQLNGLTEELLPEFKKEIIYNISKFIITNSISKYNAEDLNGEIDISDLININLKIAFIFEHYNLYSFFLNLNGQNHILGIKYPLPSENMKNVIQAIEQKIKQDKCAVSKEELDSIRQHVSQCLDVKQLCSELGV